MRNSSQTTVARIHEGMNRGNVGTRNFVDSLLSRVRFYQSCCRRSMALFGVQLGIAPRSLALVPAQSTPAMRQRKTWPTPVHLG